MGLIENLQTIKDARDNIKVAIENKGATGITDDITTYADLIDNISGDSSGDVKLFETIEEMQVDPNPSDGDLAVVYREEIQPINEESEFDSCTFPNTVVLSEAITNSFYTSFGAVDGTWYQGDFDINPDYAYFNAWGESGHIGIEYSTVDSITYTRTDGGDELQEFGTTIKWEGGGDPFNDIIGNFMKIGGNYFEGMYEYRDDTDSNAFMLNIDPKNSQDYTQGITYDLAKMNFKLQEIYDIYNVGQNTGNYNLLYVVDSFDNNGCPQIISVYPSYIVVKDMNTNKLYAGAGNIFSSTKPTGTVVVAHIDVTNKTYTTETVNYLDNILLTNNFQGKAYYSTVFAELSSEYWWFYKKNNNGWIMITDNVNFYEQGEVTVPNFFEYKYWNINSQLDTTSDYVYEKTFYGKNGVENGILTTNVSNSFADVNAEVYAQIQEQYDNMQPRVLTDQDKTIDMSIKVIPCKSDGTSLLDTSNVTDFSNMFGSCRELKTIVSIDTSNATKLSSTFGGCLELKTVPSIDTSNVTTMDYTFYNCKELVSIPSIDTSNVTNMLATFGWCEKLITIPALDTTNVTTMQEMFYYCKSLTSIPLLNTSNVIYTHGMFQNCIAMTTIPLLDMSKVTTANCMFGNCYSLTTIPAFNLSSLTDGREMFYGCSAVTTFPVFTLTNITNMSLMFGECSSLTNTGLNNILATCVTAINVTSTNKTLKYIGLTSEQATICTTLSNYQAFTNAGWTTGY